MAEEASAYGDWDTALALARQAMNQAPALSEPATIVMAQSQMAAGRPDEVTHLLEGAAFTDPDLKAKALYLLASAYREKEDWQKALQAQNDLLPLAEGLSAWIRELNGDVHVQRDEPDLAVEQYRLALEASPAEERRLLEKIADVQVRSGQFDSALDTYAEVLSGAAESALIARVHYLRGLALREMGDEEAALEAFEQAIQATPHAREAYLALVELVTAGVPVDEFRRGLINYHNGVYQAAIRAFQRHLQGDDPSSTAEAIQYIAEAYLALGQHGEALDVLEQAAAAVTDASLKAGILMTQGRVLRQAGRLSEAREAYLDAASVCPACDLAPKALWRSAETALAAGDRAGAASDFLKLQRNYPQDDGADDAMLRAALLYYLDKRYSETAQVCRELLDRYPHSERASAAHFWLGKAAIRQQDWDEAERHLRAAADAVRPDYYSIRAAALLRGETSAPYSAGNILFESDSSGDREECLAWLVGWAAEGRPYDFDTLPEDMQANADYIQGEAFAALGLSEEAAERFAQVRALWRDQPLALFQLAERLQDLGLYRASIACAERVIALSPTASAAHAPRYLQRLAYPAPYADEILAQAGAQGLDPLLLLAVIRQESRFDPLAGSWAGALGLMQVTPPTGEWIALQLGVRDFEKADLYRPSVNLRFGTWYLTRQLQDFGGEVPLALAAYNGGPGYARLWLSRLDEYDPDLFVETIPVAETQFYVRTITEQWEIYRHIYQPASALSP